MKKNIPNMLSLSRVIFAPLIVYLLFVDNKAVSIFLFFFVILVEITDFLDGYFARKLNIVSDIGKILDPFADTVLHMIVFLAFVVLGYMPLCMYIIFVYRDMLSIFMRIISSVRGFALAARFSGKLKTASRAFALIFILLLNILKHYNIDLPYDTIMYYTFLVITLITIYSFFDYITILRPKKDNSN